MHPHRDAAAIGPLDGAFHRTGQKFDEIRRRLGGDPFRRSRLGEMPFEEVVIQTQGTSRRVKSILAGQGGGLTPELLGQALARAVPLTPPVKLFTDRREGRRNLRGRLGTHSWFSRK